MNQVALTGRLTRDPEVRYTSETQLAVARFSLAVDRPYSRDEEKKADFPNIVCFGKTAEFVEKYMVKGKKVGITGRLQTGSYTNKDGVKVYTTEVVAERVEFLERKTDEGLPAHDVPDDIGDGNFNQDTGTPYEGFEKLDEDEIPF